MSLSLTPQGSVGPSQPSPFCRKPGISRREALAPQLPLQRGRKVAFLPPTTTSKADDKYWILAVVTKCISHERNVYEVQDPVPDEDGQPGQCYRTTLRAVIPLPDSAASPDSAAHHSNYPKFATGTTVLALYPDTSCFYRAKVVARTRDLNPAGRAGAVRKQSTVPMYKLKFDDDDDQECLVSARWVVEWPGRD